MVMLFQALVMLVTVYSERSKTTDEKSSSRLFFYLYISRYEMDKKKLQDVSVFSQHESITGKVREFQSSSI